MPIHTQIAKATDPEYLAGALEKVGVVDAEWKARAEAAEAECVRHAAEVARLKEVAPLIETALSHASFALDGIVALDDEDMGQDGGSDTCQHTKRTVDRALKQLRDALVLPPRKKGSGDA